MATARDRNARGSKPTERLRIQVLGRFAARYQGRDIHPQARKARALLGYLALADGSEETRERLVGLLWSESEKDKSRGSLRTALHVIGVAFENGGFTHFKSDRLATWVDRGLLEVDLWEVLEQAKRGDVHPLLLERDRIMETLLEDLESVDEAFASWLHAKRQSYHDRLVAHLEDALRGVTPDVPAGNAEPIARALARLDPTHEEAARTLIQARAAAGDAGTALAIYQALWKLLDEQFEIEPSQKTQELVARIRLSQPESAAASLAPLPSPAAPAFPSRPRTQKLILSIGGFDAAGVREDHRYLVQGFRSELAACLVRFREWSVRDLPQATAGFTPPEARDGEYIVDASAFETREGLRLILMLRDAATGEYAWSERLQLAVEQWMDTQQAVVRRLATALNVNLSAERLAAMSGQSTRDPNAHDLWLRGQSLLLTHRPAEWKSGLELLQRAVQGMPTYSPAFSGLANALNSMHISLPGVFRDARRTAEALGFAQEAVRLDPVNSRAQLCLAWSHALSGQYREAKVCSDLAFELNENDPWTRVSAICCRAVCGGGSDVLELATKLKRDKLALTPTQWAYQMITSFLLGDYQDSVDASDMAGSSFHLSPIWAAAALARLGRTAEATIEVERFLASIRARWSDASACTDALIAKWFMHAHPLRRAEDWQRLRDSVAAAGLPVDGIVMGDW